jgi:hypothetical protein
MVIGYFSPSVIVDKYNQCAFDSKTQEFVVTLYSYFLYIGLLISVLVFCFLTRNVPIPFNASKTTGTVAACWFSISASLQLMKTSFHSETKIIISYMNWSVSSTVILTLMGIMLLTQKKINDKKNRSASKKKVKCDLPSSVAFSKHRVSSSQKADFIIDVKKIKQKVEDRKKRTKLTGKTSNLL